MNIELLNPFEVLPRSVVATLEDSALCVKFNPTGRFVAAGRSDGWITVWDLETRGVLRSLEGHVKAVSSVSWSRNSRYLLTASRDWNCIVWDIGTGERRETIRFDTPVVGASFHPQNSKIMLVTLATHQTYLVDRRAAYSERVELLEPDDEVPNEMNGVEVNGEPHPPPEPSYKRIPITTAKFSPDGKIIWAGTSHGFLLAFNSRTKDLLGREKICNSSIKHLEVDPTGKLIALNCNDRQVRIYDIEEGEIRYELKDLVQRAAWNNITCSHNGDYVVGGSATKASHSIYIWDSATAELTNVLEGPKEPLVDLDWHPIRPIVASVTTSGLIHIWSSPTTEKWSAFAPRFEELEENIHYNEREDDFDFEDEGEFMRRKQAEEEFDVDVGDANDERVQRVVNGHYGGGQDDELLWANDDPDDDVIEDYFPEVFVEEGEEEEES